MAGSATGGQPCRTTLEGNVTETTYVQQLPTQVAIQPADIPQIAPVVATPEAAPKEAILNAPYKANTCDDPITGWGAAHVRRTAVIALSSHIVGSLAPSSFTTPACKGNMSRDVQIQGFRREQ